jgi:predicted RNA-binding Zn-ribbon protein involved in translation (DUF1610 family)
MLEEEAKGLLTCPVCGSAMKLARIIPKLGGLPELRTFQCASCGEVVTIEHR